MISGQTPIKARRISSDATARPGLSTPNCSARAARQTTQFGSSVSISGDKVVVGAPLSDLSTLPLFSDDGSLIPAAVDQGAAYFFVNAPFPILAANVSVGGRVLNGKQGVANAVVRLALGNGEVRTVTTGSFGTFRFDDIPVGELVVVTVTAGRYTFAPQVLTPNDNISDLNFTVDD